ncbi:PAS domain-containing protein [Myxococcaceae bacterium GXIMD 01537]
MLEQEQGPPGHEEASEAGTSGGARIADLLRQHRDAILADWQHATRTLHGRRALTGLGLLDHIPDLLERLALALEHASAGGPVDLPPGLSDVHAFERLGQGFDIHEVTVEYGNLRRCILYKLESLPVRLRTGELARLEEAIDQAVSRAVTSYVTLRERTLQALDRMTRAALDSPEPDTLLPRLLSLLMESTLMVDVVTLLLPEEDGGLRVRSVLGLGAEATLGRVQRVGEGFAGGIAAARAPRLVPAVAQEPELRDEHLHALGVRSLYGVPLLDAERLVGVAYMGSRTAYAFSEADMMLFRSMCSRATALLVQAQLRAREHATRQELQRALALVDTLLRAAPVGIAVLDRDLRYVRLNEALARINNRPLEEHTGRTVPEVAGKGVAVVAVPLLRRVLDTGEPVENTEITTREGEPEGPKHWLLNFFPVRNGGGELLGLGATVVEITPLKEAQATLERAISFREQLLAVLGHDLRNPLNAINASAFQLSRTEDLDERDARAVERIRRSAGRMARMIDDILDFARSRLGGGIPVVRRPLDMAEACRTVLEELQVSHPERQLLFEAHGDTRGTWDPDRVAQVLGNLVGNALQHGRPDTPIRTTVRGEGPDVVLEVQNQGEPITAELQPRLFDPFKGAQRPPGSKSLGLGLYIVQQLARAHGGDVAVRSTEEGTTFTVRWPREEPANGVATPFTQPAPPVT